jgi:hypothetical protein
MSSGICSCAAPTFGNMGRVNCVIEMTTVAFPIVVPRFKADGTRNTIDTASATMGADIQELLLASLDPESRLYPFPRVENVTWDRTETVFDTAPSTRKFRVDGVGGVYTFAFETWAKSAVFQIMREAKKFGCSEFDVFLVTIDGNMWGIKDAVTDTVLRGYEVSAETFDSFVTFATDTTVAKGMFKMDLDNVECVENSYAILASEMIDTGGVKATALRANVSGLQTATAVTNTTCQTIVFTGFGSAGDRDDVTNLLIADFTVENTDIPAGDISISRVESPEGTYVITTSAMTAAENHKVTCVKAGFDIADGTFVAV